MTIILILIQIIFVALIIYEVIEAAKSISAHKWPVVDGKLHRWNISTEDQGDDITRTINTFAYKYEVKGKEYESNRIGYGFPLKMSILYVNKALDKVLSKAPELTVYFKPTEPDVSVLIVGLKLYHVIKIVSYAFAAICLYIMTIIVNQS